MECTSLISIGAQVLQWRRRSRAAERAPPQSKAPQQRPKNRRITKPTLHQRTEIVGNGKLQNQPPYRPSLSRPPNGQASSICSKHRRLLERLPRKQSLCLQRSQNCPVLCWPLPPLNLLLHRPLLHLRLSCPLPPLSLLLRLPLSPQRLQQPLHQQRSEQAGEQASSLQPHLRRFPPFPHLSDLPRLRSLPHFLHQHQTPLPHLQCPVRQQKNQHAKK